MDLCSSGFDLSNLSELSSRDLVSFCADARAGSSQSPALESEKGGVMKAASKLGKRRDSSSEARKSVASLRNHSEAERRRRERINGHFTTLRGFVPPREKMDKATLLAEVIGQVKELKQKATNASKGLLIPMDTDEVSVEPHNNGPEAGRLYFRASLCCKYRPELLSDLRQALDVLHIDIVKAEISTLGFWVKNVFVFTVGKEGKGNDTGACHLASSVHKTLRSVLDKGSGLSEFSPRTSLQSNSKNITAKQQ